MTDRRRILAGYLWAGGTLLLDQVSKKIALGSLELHEPVDFIGSVVRFTLAWNQGAAFSLPWGGPLFLTVITAAAAVLLSVMIWRSSDRYPRVFLAGMGVILGGALGNLLDRFFYGRVVDFIDAGFGLHRWPTFNVADIAITVGGILLIIIYRKESPGNKKVCCNDGGE